MIFSNLVGTPGPEIEAPVSTTVKTIFVTTPNCLTLANDILGDRNMPEASFVLSKFTQVYPTRLSFALTSPVFLSVFCQVGDD